MKKIAYICLIIVWIILISSFVYPKLIDWVRLKKNCDFDLANTSYYLKHDDEGYFIGSHEEYEDEFLCDYPMIDKEQFLQLTIKQPTHFNDSCYAKSLLYHFVSSHNIDINAIKKSNIAAKRTADSLHGIYPNTTSNRKISFDETINKDGTISITWYIWIDGEIAESLCCTPIVCKPNEVSKIEDGLKKYADKQIAFYSKVKSSIK